MGRAFRIYARGQEKEVIEYIETHNTEEIEERFGYKWFATIKPWYDKHKGDDPLGLNEIHCGNNLSPYQKLVSAIIADHNQLQDKVDELTAQLKEANKEMEYLRKSLRSREIGELQSLNGLYECVKS